MALNSASISVSTPEVVRIMPRKDRDDGFTIRTGTLQHHHALWVYDRLTWGQRQLITADLIGSAELEVLHFPESGAPQIRWARFTASSNPNGSTLELLDHRPEGILTRIGQGVRNLRGRNLDKPEEHSVQQNASAEASSRAKETASGEPAANTSEANKSADYIAKLAILSELLKRFV